MKRRTFLKSVVVGSAAGFCKGDEHLTASTTRPALDPAVVARELAAHRIAKIEARRSNDRYARSIGRNRTGKRVGRGFGRQIRVLTTDQGVKGGAMSGLPDSEARRFVGAKVSDLFDLTHGTADEAAPLDLPLHDLVGHILNRPVCDLLGNHGTRKVPIYSAAIYFDDLEETGKLRGIDRLLTSCQDDYDSGYRAFKLKLGRGLHCMPKREGQRRDIEITLAVRERFGECKIVVDANDSYSVEDFLAYVTGVKDSGLYIIEEPFSENRDDLRRLRDHMAKVGCKALIMEGESGGGPAERPWRYGSYSRKHIEQLFALADEQLVDVFNMDLAGVGFTRWRRVMDELVKAGVTASPHTWAGTPRPYYCAHLAAGVGNVLIVEGIPGTATGMDYSAWQFDDGNVVVPDAPGFGLRLSS
ncbi:MAG: mandelate racemase [Planctomycetes bacterium]|nr:mandelate racemase [Planctomycetota bacterium]MBL7037047.1 mandelate racemase [Pirellulaceae bacterium]